MGCQGLTTQSLKASSSCPVLWASAKGAPPLRETCGTSDQPALSCPALGARKGSPPDLENSSPRYPSLATRPRSYLTTQKPRIRLGCPSWSTFSGAPQKLLLADFGRKEYGYGTSWRGFNSTPGTYFISTLGFATKQLFWETQASYQYWYWKASSSRLSAPKGLWVHMTSLAQ